MGVNIKGIELVVVQCNTGAVVGRERLGNAISGIWPAENNPFKCGSWRSKWMKGPHSPGTWREGKAEAYSGREGDSSGP